MDGQTLGSVQIQSFTCISITVPITSLLNLYKKQNGNNNIQILIPPNL